MPSPFYGVLILDTEGGRETRVRSLTGETFARADIAYKGVTYRIEVTDDGWEVRRIHKWWKESTLAPDTAWEVLENGDHSFPQEEGTG